MDSDPASPPHALVFLLDVDNTLLDNDAVIDDLRRHLVSTFGRACQIEYWRMFEQLRRELGYADYLGALQRYRAEHPRDPDVLGRLAVPAATIRSRIGCTRARSTSSLI